MLCACRAGGLEPHACTARLPRRGSAHALRTVTVSCAALRGQPAHARMQRVLKALMHLLALARRGPASGAARCPHPPLPPPTPLVCGGLPKPRSPVDRQARPHPPARSCCPPFLLLAPAPGPPGGTAALRQLVRPMALPPPGPTNLPFHYKVPDADGVAHHDVRPVPRLRP